MAEARKPTAPIHVSQTDEEVVFPKNLTPSDSDSQLFAPRVLVDAFRWQLVIVSWPSQVLIFILVLAHCSSYFGYHVEDDDVHLDVGDDQGSTSDNGLSTIIWWQWSTGGLIVVVFAAEILIRVAAQGGPLYRCTSWQKFMKPWMHKFELLALVGVTYRFAKTLITGSQWLSDYTPQEDEYSRLTVGFLIMYRVLRFLTEKMQVSVVSTLEYREKMTNLRTREWAQDIKERLAEHGQYRSVQLQKIVNRIEIQVVMVILVISQSFCYSYPLTQGEGTFQEMYSASTVIAYVLLVLFFFEMLVRYLAQGGERFFLPFLNKMEALFLASGLFWLCYQAWYSNAIREGDDNHWHPSGTGVASILLLHRLCRALGIYYEISGDAFTANTVAGAQTASVFISKFGHVLEIAPANVHVGVKEIWIQKAKLKRSAFQDLHLPMKIYDGLVEELYVKLPDSLVDPVFLLRLQNVLVLLSPGDGLAEAGGLSESSDYWNYETVLEAKARLVELICKNIQPAKPAKPAAKSEVLKTESLKASTASTGVASMAGAVSNNMKYHAANVIKAAKEKMTSSAKAFCRRVEVNISNVTLQYEDTDGSLGQRQVRIGSRLGSVWVHFESGAFLQCDVSRVGFYIEPIIKEDQPSNQIFSQQYWKEPLPFLINKHPKEALEELKRFNVAERFRMWAFDALSAPLPHHDVMGRKPPGDMQRFWRSERWPEHRLVFSLLTVHIQAGTARGLQHLKEQEKRTKATPSEKNLMGKRPNIRERLSTMAQLSIASVKAEVNSDKPSSAESERWTWYVNTGRSKTPVSVMIDYDQVQCLHTILDCYKSWNMLDNAFRWRPDMSLSDELAREEAQLDERRGLARQWWVYAIHRVLAKRKLRPRVPWMDVVWQSHNVARYRLLLRDTGYASKAHKKLDSVRETDEKRAMKELQVRLPIVSIMACHKNVQPPAPGTVEQAVSSAVLSPTPIADGIQRFRTDMSDRLKQFRSGLSKPSSHTSKPTSNGQEDIIETLSGNTLFVFEHDSPDLSTPATDFTAAGPVQATGKWVMFLPCFEVRVLCPSVPPRPVILHAKWTDIAVDLVFGSQAERAREDVAEKEDLMFALTVTVADFGVVCPHANELLLGGSRDMMTVVQHLELPPLVAGSRFVTGHRQDGPIAFAFRAFAIPGKSGKAEMHVPHMRVTIMEPLVLELKKFSRKADANSAFYPDCLEEDRRAAWVMRKAGKKISQVVQKDGGGGVLMKNGRFGPTLSASLVAFVTDADRSAEELLGWAHENAEHIQHVRTVRRLVKKATAFRRKFELASGFGGAIKEWRLAAFCGGIHGWQIGEYSDNLLAVEEYRIRNSVWNSGGAASEFQQDIIKGALPHRLVHFDFNGFSDSMLSSWGDEQWHELPQSRVDSSIERSEKLGKLGLISRLNSASSFFSGDVPGHGSMTSSFQGKMASRWGFCCAAKQKHASSNEAEVTKEDSGEVVMTVPSEKPVASLMAREDNGPSLSRPPQAPMTVLVQGVRRDVFGKRWLMQQSLRWRADYVRKVVDV